MTALSSFRPHRDSGEYRQNQIRAKNSWEPIFKNIIYFGHLEPELTSPKTEFIPYDGWPFIREMAEIASKLNGYTAIINADIVIEPELSTVVAIMERTGIVAATSMRRDLETREILFNDKGRDIFILNQRWWKRVADKVPRSCRIGHFEWDSWMIGFLCYEAKTKFADFSQVKCVFHPKHGGRKMPFNGEVNINSKYKGYWNGTRDTAIIL